MQDNMIRLRLSVLLFLQFFIWGAWYLSVSMYMATHGMNAMRYVAYTAGPLAAIIAPVFSGMIADRFFNTEKVLAVLFLFAGLFMLLLYKIGGMGDPAGFQESRQTIVLLGRTVTKGNLFNLVILAHMLFFMPTLGLTAGLSFTHLPKGNEEFPLVRLWGTIGWIVAGFILAFGFSDVVVNQAGEKTSIEAGTKAVQFLLAGGASLALGIYCFFLPRTPAPKKGQVIALSDFVFSDAWNLFKQRSFAVFMICSFLLCIPLAAYYASLQQQMMAMKITHITALKNIGTFFEAGLMFLMPFFFRRLGYKKVLLIGIGAWVVRYVLFALGAGPGQVAFILVVLGIALHGLCYDFFFVTGQVYVDASTSSSIRGQTQGLYIFFTQGLGMLIGAMIVNRIASAVFAPVDGKSVLPEALPYWPGLWWPLAITALVVFLVFLFAFHPQNKTQQQARKTTAVKKAVTEM